MHFFNEIMARDIMTTWAGMTCILEDSPPILLTDQGNQNWLYSTFLIHCWLVQPLTNDQTNALLQWDYCKRYHDNMSWNDTSCLGAFWQHLLPFISFPYYIVLEHMVLRCTGNCSSGVSYIISEIEVWIVIMPQEKQCGMSVVWCNMDWNDTSYLEPLEDALSHTSHLVVLYSNELGGTLCRELCPAVSYIPLELKVWRSHYATGKTVQSICSWV